LEIPTAVGAIVAAMIGALMVLISTILSKEQKTSEFRQSWVDSLRSDLSEFAGSASLLINYTDHNSRKNETEIMQFLSENHDRLERLKSLAISITLRLNPNEHQELIGIVERFLGDLIKEIENKSDDDENFSPTEKKLISESQRILKEEWARVKKGEIGFRLVKYGSAIGACVALIFGIAAYLNNRDVQAPLGMSCSTPVRAEFFQN
jgi:hypothetical protein